ncbi:MAG: ATP-binding protein [Anaerolineae bacterium]
MPSITFPARFEFLDEIRHFVGEEARRAGFNEKEIYSIQLATDEAASNVIEHAYQGIPDGEIEISCEFRDNALVIVLRDQGKPFDPRKVRVPDLKADLSKRQIGGLGLYLMRRLMDEVRFEPAGERGNLLTMVKRRK